MLDSGGGWQRQGHRCWRLRHLGVVCHVMGSRFDAQMDIVIAAFVECREAKLALPLPLVPFCPLLSTFFFNSVHALPSALSLRHPWTVPTIPAIIVVACESSSSSPLLYVRYIPVLADGI